MKTIIVFLLIGFSLKAQIKFEGFTNIGWTNWSKSVYAESKQYTIKSKGPKSLYSEVQISGDWKGLKLSTNITTFMNKSAQIYFKPTNIDFTISLDYTKKWFKIGAAHQCSHPIISDYQETQTDFYRASYDRVYIGVKF